MAGAWGAIGGACQGLGEGLRALVLGRSGDDYGRVGKLFFFTLTCGYSGNCGHFGHGGLPFGQWSC